MNQIQLVTVDDLLSPADRFGREGDASAPIPDPVPLSAWRPQWATAGTARRLRLLNERVVAAGGAPLRVRRIGRPWEDQAAVRRAFDAWVAAGQPDPGSAKWKQGMSTAYAAPPGESHHGWGGAADLDRNVFEFPGTGRRTNAALEVMWEIAASVGGTPIIAQPRISQSEAWHFDFLGELAAVRDALRATGRRDAGKWTAITGHALTGKWRGDAGDARYIQARLLLHAAHEWAAAPGSTLPPTFPGVPDGKIGPKTQEALRVAVGDLGPRPVLSEIVAALDGAKIATTAMAAA